MAVNTLHTLGPIVVSGTGGFNLDGVTDATPDTGLGHVMEMGAGQADNSYIAVMNSAPLLTATVTDIATALVQIGISGMAFPQTTVITTVAFYHTKVAQGGVRTSGAAHFRVLMNEGMAIMRSITCTQNQRATAQIDFHTSYDGSNVPFVYGTSVALPHTATVDELFTIGKVMINGAQLEGIVGITIDFGLDIFKESSDGEVYPTFLAIQRRQPRIEIRTKDVLALNTFGLLGTAQGATDSIVYLQKIAEGGSRVAAATAEHISFTIDDGMITVTNSGGGNNESSEATVLIHPVFDGTTPVLVVNAATAIA